MSESITSVGVEPTDRHEVHYGDERVVYDRITLQDYNTDTTRPGNDYDVASIYGFSRILHVDVETFPGTGYIAKWDPLNKAIRVFNISDGSEVSNGTTLNLGIALRVEGTGT